MKIVLKLVHTIPGSRFGYINQMIRNLPSPNCIVSKILSRSYIHSAKHLPAVGTYYLAVNLCCQLGSKRSLAAGCGS